MAGSSEESPAGAGDFFVCEDLGGRSFCAFRGRGRDVDVASTSNWRNRRRCLRERARSNCQRRRHQNCSTLRRNLQTTLNERQPLPNSSMRPKSQSSTVPAPNAQRGDRDRTSGRVADVAQNWLFRIIRRHEPTTSPLLGCWCHGRRMQQSGGSARPFQPWGPGRRGTAR
jgi:hypothetical protein